MSSNKNTNKVEEIRRNNTSDDTDKQSKIELRYQALFHNTIDGIFIYNYEKEAAVDCNKAALKILGYELREELLGQTRFDFVPKTSEYFPGLDLHEITKGDGARVMNGESFGTKGVFIGKNGKKVLVKANVVPTFYEHGEAFIIFQDVTSKVLAKIAKKESDKRYRDIFANSHEAIVYIDIKTQTPIICNDNALTVFGLSSLEELKKMKPQDFLTQVQKEGVNAIRYFKKSVMRAIRDGRVEISFWLKKKNNEKIRVNCVMIADKSDPKHPKVITFIRDITKLHHVQQELTKKNEELQRYITSNLQLENFAYFASHDLQTPLRSIVSFTQLLQRSLQGRTTNEEQEYMEFITSYGKNMSHLINDILSYSKVDSTDANAVQVNLSSLLENLIGSIKSTIKEKNANIELKNIPENIVADFRKIQQVFQNLLTNALKFNQQDISPKIIISCIEKSDHWQFSIKDNGIGIAPEFQKKIFGMFKRLHNPHQYEGTGIGLALVKKIIEQHQGNIWVKSEINQGADFFFTIPKINSNN